MKGESGQAVPDEFRQAQQGASICGVREVRVFVGRPPASTPEGS